MAVDELLPARAGDGCGPYIRCAQCGRRGGEDPARSAGGLRDTHPIADLEGAPDRTENRALARAVARSKPLLDIFLGLTASKLLR